MEQEIENLDSQNQEEVITQETPELGLPADPVEVEPIEEEIDDTAELKQKNQELYEQLKKAKGFIRDKDGKWIKKEAIKPTEKVEGTGDVTKTELYSLVKANVPDEDVNEVVIYARSHKMTVTEALKTAEVKAILGVKADYRKTAEAANTRNSRFGGKAVSDEQIAAEIAEGKLPDPDKLADYLQRKRLANRPK
jgi:hypothetical protein